MGVNFRKTAGFARTYFEKCEVPAMEQDALEQKRAALLAAGVLMMDPSAVYVEAGVTVGAGTLLLPAPSCGETQ